MIVKIVTGFCDCFITDCPDMYKGVTIAAIYDDYDDEDISVVVQKTLQNSTTTTVINDNDVKHDICEFVEFQKLTKNMWQFFMNILGFVPFYDAVVLSNSKQHCKYVELPQYDKLDDLYAIRKPANMMELRGVQIPVAIFNEMRTFTNMKETTGSIDVVFPPEIEPYVESALSKIMTVEDYTLEDMIVYNFLDMLHLFRKNTSWFISGDKLYEVNTINLYKAGYISDGFKRIHFIYTGLDSHVNVPDTIIEVSEQYQKIEKRYSDIGAFELKALKLFTSRK